MNVCDYAACNRVAMFQADGWNFCREHIQHHLALMSDKPLPASAPIFPAEVFFQPCGTAAAAKRHSRRGERSCDLCREAATRLRNGYTSTTKKWHGIAS